MYVKEGTLLGQMTVKPGTLLGLGRMKVKPGTLLGFGQSAPESAAVGTAQTLLVRLGYNTGGIDDLYGPATHWALVSAIRDLLVPSGQIEATCQHTCNTLRSGSSSFCADCIRRALPLLAAKSLDGPSISSSVAAEVASAYQAFLPAWIAEHGAEVPEVDVEIPDETSLDEIPGTGDEVPLLPGVDDDGVPAANGDEVSADFEPAMQTAGFPWWWTVLFAAVLMTPIGVVLYRRWKYGEEADIDAMERA